MLLVIIIILVIISILLFKKYKNKDLVIINRNKEAQTLINEVLKKKEQNFTEAELKVLKNNTQFFNDVNNENITKNIINEKTQIPLSENTVISHINTNPSLNVILNNNNQDLTFSDVAMLKDKDYLKNFYYDMYGNRINATLKDYYVNYLTNIDNKNEVCNKVDIVKGYSGFIIPDMYPLKKYQTNAYNIDYSRIINPMTIY